MSEGESKSVDVLPVMTKITEHKLNSNNYLDWRQTIDLYLLSVSMDTHITDDPPTDDSKLTWARMDAKLFLQIRNSISSEVVGMVTHCRTVKSLLSYLEFLYLGKWNVSRMYDVCQAFCKPEQDLRELLSAVRRKDAHAINGYLASRRNSKKMIQKSLKILRRSVSACSEKAIEEMALISMLRDAESIAFSLLKSLLAYTLGMSVNETKSSWSLVSMLMNSKKAVDEENEFNKVDSFLQQSQENELVNHLKEIDSSIQVVEEELESVFRQLIKTRVSLLNILNH